MFPCKKCGSNNTVKSGIVGGRQRFRCKECNCNFRIGDKRTNEKVAAKKFLCILLHITTHSSFRTISKLVQTDTSLVYRWIKKFNTHLHGSQLFNKNKTPIKLEEILHYCGLKKENFELLKQLVMRHEKLLPEFLVSVILRNLDTTNKTVNPIKLELLHNYEKQT